MPRMGALEPAEIGGNAMERVRAPAVFISYASQDAQAAKRICAALRAADIEVWFDQSELRGGDVWDRQIRQQIHDCRLFMPIVSANTEARAEGYFRREWKLAVDRTHDLSERVAFLVPIVIDSTPEAKADVPDAFRHVQWTRLSDGSASPAFVERIQRLITPVPSSALPAATAPPDYRTPQLSTTTNGRHRVARVTLWALSGVVALGLAYFVADRFWLSKHTSAERPAAAVAPALTLAMPAIPEKSVAVLPFVDMSEKKDQEYFSDGLSEELIDMLTKVPELRVPARTSSFYFKGKQATIADIAKALGVAHVLEGSVRKSGNILRITAELIRVDNGYHVWSETYDRKLDDIFKMQDEIAAAVVAALKIKLRATRDSKDGQTSIPEAYDQYLIGRGVLRRDDWRFAQRAVDAFQKAIALDPGYVAAWSGLSAAKDDLAQTATTIAEHDARDQEALAAANKAIAAGPDVPDGYAARAALRAYGLWDFEGAAEDFRRASTLAPGDVRIRMSGVYSVLWPTGRLDEALATAKNMSDIDPLNSAAWNALGWTQYFHGDYRGAVTSFKRSIEITPDQSRAAAGLAVCYLLEGQPALALSLSQQPTQETFRLLVAALAEHDLGHMNEAKAKLDELITKHGQASAFQIAQVYAWEGDKDRAFAWLDKAYTQHDGGLTLVKVDPLLRGLRSDPRYKALLRKMKLPE
jgi:TolB-like protein/Tfp pilus assembly protein PilF